METGQPKDSEGILSAGMAPAPSRSVSSIRLPELDGVRGFALSMILIWHFVVGTIVPHADPPWLVNIAKYLTVTWSSIDMFFVLSGFLIGGILMDHRRAENLFRVFYVRRCLRIMPLYTVWVLVYFIIMRTPAAPRLPWLFDDPLPGWGYVFYLQNMVAWWENRFGPHWMGITWSLAVEEQFYLLLPLMVWLLPRRWILLASVLAVLSATPLRIVTQHLSPGADFAAWFPIWCRWDSLFCGVVLAGMRRQPWWETTGTRQGLAYGWLLLFITGAWLAILTARGEGSPGQWHVMTYGLTVISLFYSSILFLVLHPGPLRRFFARQPWVFMGTISYGLYIFHQGVLGIAHGLVHGGEPRLDSWGRAATTLASLVLTILFARWSYERFEKPCVAWGHSWKYRESPSRTESRE